MQIKSLFLVVIEIGFYFFNSLSINSKITFNSSMDLTLSSATMSLVGISKIIINKRD